MRRRLIVAASVALTAATGACSTPADPSRLVFGVSAERPATSSTAEADAQTRAFLDWKLNQICTLGYDTVKVDTLAAEDNNQIVEEDVRCKPYRLRLF